MGTQCESHTLNVPAALFSVWAAPFAAWTTCVNRLDQCQQNCWYSKRFTILWPRSFAVSWFTTLACIIDHMFVLFAPSCSRSKTCLICRCASIRGIWICKASALVCFSSSAGSYAPRVADSVWSIHRNCGNTSREWSPRAEDPPAQDSDN